MSDHKLHELTEYLELAKLKFGYIDPHISYFNRMIEDAAKHEKSLQILYDYIKENDGFRKFI